jgi:xanthosine utilization system XapX-like protein
MKMYVFIAAVGLPVGIVGGLQLGLSCGLAVGLIFAFGLTPWVISGSFWLASDYLL